MRPISLGLVGSLLVAGFGSRGASAEPRLQPPLGRRHPHVSGREPGQVAAGPGLTPRLSRSGWLPEGFRCRQPGGVPLRTRHKGAAW